MHTSAYTVLIVDDNLEDRFAFRRYLERSTVATFTCWEAETAVEGLQRCREQLPDAILLDYLLPDDDGLGFLSAISAQHGPHVSAVVVLTGAGDEAVAVQAMKLGAQDYLVKNGRLEHRLAVAVTSAVEKVRLHQEVARQRRDLERGNAELQRALSAAHAADAQLRMALQAAKLQSWELDIATGEVTAYAGAGPGLPAVVADYADFWSLVHHEDVAAVQHYVEELLAGAGSDEIEFRLIEPGGEVRWVSNRAYVVRDAAGQPQRLIGLHLDITERKLAQLALAEERSLLAERVAERTAELLAANEQLARAAQLKDEFLASMSHELRTPLNAVLGFNEAIAEEIYGPVTPRQAQALAKIDASGRHLLALINDILDLAKIGSGTVVLDRQPTPVRPLCEASVEMVTAVARTKHVSVDLTYDPHVTVLDVDARRLKQMLVNLLSNAVKFTPAGGALGLRVVGDRAAAVVRFSVWDTGIGIAPEQIQRLFQPFVQLDSGLARQYDGTGLGLALVERMAQLHDGTVDVASEPGRGSCFTLSLPWLPAASTPAPGVPDYRAHTHPVDCGGPQR